MTEHESSNSRLFVGVDLYLHGIELVVTSGDGRDELLQAARRAYAPTTMVAGAWASASLRAGKTPAPDGRAQAYVCDRNGCLAPVTDSDALTALLTREPA